MAQAAPSKPCRWMCLQWRDVSALARRAEAVAQAGAGLDELVYALYGLTPAKRDLVKKTARK